MRISSRFSHLFPLHSYIMFLMLLPFLISCSTPFHCLFNFIQIFSITFNPILSHSITVYSIFQSHFFFCNYYFLTAYIIGISVNDFNFDLFIIYSFPFKICKDLESNGRMDFHDDPNMKTLWESQKKPSNVRKWIPQVTLRTSLEILQKCKYHCVRIFQRPNSVDEKWGGHKCVVRIW